MTAKMQPFWWFKAPVITCPEGEQIINGDFETGDFTGWTPEGNIVAITTEYIHTGAYACEMMLMAPDTGAKQILATPLHVSCVKSFTVWQRNEFAWEGNQKIIIGYTDDTTSELEYLVTGTWTQFDLTPALTAGKTIEYIKFCTLSSDYLTIIDDVSLISGS